MTQRVIDGNFVYFVTFNVHTRRWFFVTAERAETLGQAMRTCCQMKRFDLLAYCILPNHVHLLVRRGGAITSERTLGSMRSEKYDDVKEGVYLFAHRRLPSRRSVTTPSTLSDLMHSIKSTFSQRLRQGKFWHRRSFIRIVGDERYFNHLIDYIRYNYRKMNLRERYGQAPFVFVDWEAVSRTVG